MTHHANSLYRSPTPKRIASSTIPAAAGSFKCIGPSMAWSRYRSAAAKSILLSRIVLRAGFSGPGSLPRQTIALPIQLLDHCREHGSLEVPGNKNWRSFRDLMRKVPRVNERGFHESVEAEFVWCKVSPRGDQPVIGSSSQAGKPDLLSFATSAHLVRLESLTYFLLRLSF